MNNPALNNIVDGDAYTVEIDFPGSIVAPGAFNPLTRASMIFTDGLVTETRFSSVFLTVSVDSNPTLYDISLLGCLSTGSACGVGNDLSANFAVAVASFNSLSAPAQFIPGLVPSFDLLEDDGVTDIQGTISSFSNSSTAVPSSVPEPSSMVVTLAFGLLAMLTRKRGLLEFERRKL